MADNTQLNTGTGGDIIGADEIDGVKYQRIKLIHGADGVNDGDVSSGNPLPVSVGGTVTVGSHAVTNEGTFVVQINGDALTSLQLIDNAISGAGFNVTQFGGAAVPIGAGTEATAIRVTLPTDGTGVVRLGAGTAGIGKLTANSGVDIGDVDVTSIAAGDNNIGNVDIVTVPADPFGANADAASATGSISAKLRFIASTGIPITGTVTVGSHAVTNAGVFAVQASIATATSGGYTTYHLVSANTTNATVVKNSAGTLYGWYIYNNNTSMRKVAFHNTASAPTAGASIFFSLPIPGSSGANVFMPHGIAFSSGIAITTVTDITDAGTTAVGTSDLTINLFYA